MSSTVDAQVRVVAGETYTVSIWDRFGGAGTRTVSIRLIFRDDANVIIENPAAVTQTTTGGTYVRLSRTLTAPAGATRAQIIMAFHLVDAVVGDVHTFDGLMVEQSAALDDYIDGDTGGAQWLGEPHASPSMIGNILFRGHLDGYDVLPDIGQRSVSLSAVDVIGRLQQVKLSTGLFPADKTGRAIHRVLDQLRWPQDLRDIDVGATTIRWWWEEGTDAFTALERIVASEGPGALATVDTNGRFVFRSRHHRLTSPESLNVQATFRGDGTEPLFSAPLVYDVGWRDIVNSVQFDVDERDPDNNRSDVWSDAGIIRLADGEAITIKAQASDPFTGAVPPLAGVDYILRFGAVDISLSRTNGQSTQIQIKAVGGPAEVEGLKLRAFAVRVQRTIQVAAEDAESITQHGIRSYGRNAPWLNTHDAAAVAVMILAHRAKRAPTVSMRLASGEAGDPTRLAQQMSRDLSDRIHIVGSDAEIDDDFYLEQIQHTISHAGKAHDTVFGCEKIATQPTDVFILDVSQLDVGQLGVQGLDDPERIFIFNHATQGQFDVGLFAH